MSVSSARPSTVSPVALGAFLLLAACGGDAPAPEAAPADPPAGQLQPGEPEEIDLAVMGYDEGDVEGAPVRIVEFSDFGCVFCARFHTGDYEALHQEFVAAGDVAWKYIPITIGGFPNGNLAAVTAECVGDQGHFAEIRDLLFEERTNWMEASGPEAEALFRDLAETAGADLESWEACVGGEEVVRRIERSNRAAVELGVRGTPTFIVQGFPVQGAPALGDFQAALREMIADVRAGGPAPGDTSGG
jgi:protein-disulfide isomerase